MTDTPAGEEAALADVIPLPSKFDGQGMCEFHDDGTVTLALSEGPVRLRRPVFGEFRNIEDGFHRMQDDIDAATDRYRDDVKPYVDEMDEIGKANLERWAEKRGVKPEEVEDPNALPLDKEGQELLDQALRKTKQFQRPFTRTVQDLRMAWVEQVLSTVADRPISGGELEPWMFDPGFVVELLNHFQTRPFRRSPTG